MFIVMYTYYYMLCHLQNEHRIAELAVSSRIKNTYFTLIVVLSKFCKLKKNDMKKLK